MTAGERELIDRARDSIAARITAAHPDWRVGHDLYGWHARRLDDGHVLRASGPAGLRALMDVAPPPAALRAADDLRRAYPGWHIWRDRFGDWHACRRGTFRELRAAGAPRYAVHAPDLVRLRAELLEQQEPEPGEEAG
jgi:hypothetical protein